MSGQKPLLIAGGRLMDPASELDAPRDLLLENGKVAAIAEPGSLTERAKILGAETLDASGLIVAPGLLDIHVHLREPGQTWKETIATGTRAAAAGGFTTVCAMPNTVPVTDSAEWVRWVMAPERGAYTRVLPVAAATVGSMGERLTDYDALCKAGAVGVTDDGKPILGDAVMHQALREAARFGMPVTQHAEDTRMTPGASMNAGALAFRMGLRGMPVEAESSIVERDIALVRALRDEEGVEARLHVQHISTRRALDAVRHAKQEGLGVTCEVMPHHFALDESAVEGYNTHAKMNPPLRSADDRLAMLEGLLDGSVDCLATDHAPHAAFEKEQEFERAPNGITGLETALGLSLRILHGDHNMPLSRVLALWTSKAAAVLGLEELGKLCEGSVGDVVIFDPAREWTFHAQQALSRSKNSPFDNWTMRGQVRWTIWGGRITHVAS